MITKENYSEEHIRQIQNDSHRDGIEFQLMITAPGDCFLQGITGSTGPEDELVA